LSERGTLIIRSAARRERLTLSRPAAMCPPVRATACKRLLPGKSWTLLNMRVARRPI